MSAEEDRDINFSDESFSDQSYNEGAASDESSEGADSPSEIDRLKSELAESKDKYLRALADFENFKKRSLKERSDLLKYEGAKIVTDLLEVLDNLELALDHAESDPSKLADGIKMIHKLFIDSLGKWEIRSKSAIDKDFDPTTQNAISKVPAQDPKSVGKVISEFKKPYFYKDKLIRPGEVVVAVSDEDNS